MPTLVHTQHSLLYILKLDVAMQNQWWSAPLADIRTHKQALQLAKTSYPSYAGFCPFLLPLVNNILRQSSIIHTKRQGEKQVGLDNMNQFILARQVCGYISNIYIKKVILA